MLYVFQQKQEGISVLWKEFNGARVERRAEPAACGLREVAQAEIADKEGAEVDRIGWECPLLAWRLGCPDLLECSTLVGIPGKVTEESSWQWRMNDETKA